MVDISQVYNYVLSLNQQYRTVDPMMYVQVALIALLGAGGIITYGINKIRGR